MTWGEAWRLYVVLSRDPSSALAAAQEGWDYPLDRTALIAADLYDLTHQIAAGGKHTVKAYPRPWSTKDTSRLGQTSLPGDVVRALLARRAPQREEVDPAPPARPRDARGRFLPTTQGVTP